MSKFSSPSIEAWNSYLGISDSTRGRPKIKNRKITEDNLRSKSKS